MENCNYRCSSPEVLVGKTWIEMIARITASSVMRVFYWGVSGMGKSERKKFWDEHEKASDQVERARSKKLKDDKSKIWTRACGEYLEANHFCQDCRKRGYTSPAEHVGHIEPPQLSQVKFWNIDNWRALCDPCYQRLTGGKTMAVLEPIPKNTKLYTVK